MKEASGQDPGHGDAHAEDRRDDRHAGRQQGAEGDRQHRQGDQDADAPRWARPARTLVGEQLSAEVDARGATRNGREPVASSRSAMVASSSRSSGMSSWTWTSASRPFSDIDSRLRSEKGSVAISTWSTFRSSAATASTSHGGRGPARPRERRRAPGRTCRRPRGTAARGRRDPPATRCPGSSGCPGASRRGRRPAHPWPPGRVPREPGPAWTGGPSRGRDGRGRTTPGYINVSNTQTYRSGRRDLR